MSILNYETYEQACLKSPNDNENNDDDTTVQWKRLIF